MQEGLGRASRGSRCLDDKSSTGVEEYSARLHAVSVTPQEPAESVMTKTLACFSKLWKSRMFAWRFFTSVEPVNCSTVQFSCASMETMALCESLNLGDARAASRAVPRRRRRAA